MRIFSSLVDRLSGGTHPRAISLAVFLGLLAGFVQGWNLSLVALLALALLFDIRTRVALVGWGVGLALSWLLAPVTFLLGRLVLDLTPAGVWLGGLGDGRWAALFGWDRYTVVGGLLIGLAVAWPASGLLTRGVRRTRSLLKQARQVRNRLVPHDQPDVIAFPRSRISLRARIVDGVRGATRRANEPGEGERLFRRGGLVAATALVLVTVAAVIWQAPQIARGRLYLAVQRANQARLEAGRFDLALWDGSLEIQDLRLADPNCLTHDRLRIGFLSAKLDPAALLAGRLAVRHVDVSGVRTHVERGQAASPVDGAPACEAIPDVLANAAILPAPQAAGVAVHEHLAAWPELRQAIGVFGQLLSHIEQMRQECQPPTPSLSLAAIAATDLATLRAARSPLGRPAPAISIETLRIDDLNPDWQLGDRASLTASRLASGADAWKGMRIEIDAPERRVHLAAESATHRGRRGWNVHLEAQQVPLAELAAYTRTRQPLAIDAGELTITGAGWADEQGFELPLSITAQEIACRSIARRDVLGIRSDLWAEGLGRLHVFTAEAVCRGSWIEPRLEVDGVDLAERFRHQLRAAGEHEMLAALDAPASLADAGSPAEHSVESPPEPTQNQQPSADASVAEFADAETLGLEGEAEQVASGAGPIASGRPAYERAPPAATAPPADSVAIAATPPAAQSPLAPWRQHAAEQQQAAVQQYAPAEQRVVSMPAQAPMNQQHPLSQPQPTAADSPQMVLRGPGPLDLATGHELLSDVTDRAPAPRTMFARNVAPKREVLPDEPLWSEPGDAELDKWVEEQERAEAQRQRALAKKSKSSRRNAAERDLIAPPDEEESSADLAAEKPNQPGWLARVRSIWPFGAKAQPDELYDLTPAREYRDPEHTARGQGALPAEGGSTWR